MAGEIMMLELFNAASAPWMRPSPAAPVTRGTMAA